MSERNINDLADGNYLSSREAIYRHTDGLFAWLMLTQWVLGVAMTLWLSPWTWTGSVASVHPHVWAAIFLGGLIISLPILLAWRMPGSTLTRHTFAVAQMLYGALLIHLSGGRIETHFHVFGSLAFLAFYRDSKVLVTASVVVMLDHFLRGMFWPESIYGAVAAPIWRTFEHAGWVIFEDVFLIVAIRKSLGEMRRVARREAELEILNSEVERKVVERTRQLEESRERFAQLAENSPDVFWFLDLNPLTIRYISPSVETVWGVPRARFYEDAGSWMDCVYPDDRPMVLEAFEQSTGKGHPTMVCDYRIVVPSGEIRWIHFRGTLIRDEEGNAIRLGGIAKDITERRRAEERMMLDAQRLRIAAKAGGLGIWELDLQTNVLDWDDQAYSLYGMTKEGAAPGLERWRSCVHPDDVNRIESALKKSIETTGQLDAEFRIIRQDDGEIRHIRAVATTFRDDEGKPVRVIGTNWDATEDRLREQALREALGQQTLLTEAAQAGERTKREFLAVMSHEIRTPLAGMLGFASEALEVKNLPPEAADCLGTITDSGEALLRIINDILDFSRMEAGKLRIEDGVYSPRALVEDIQVFFSHQARSKDLGLDVRTLGDLPEWVRGDAGRIRQVLLNLVSNALKFTVVGGIRIVARVKEGTPGETGLEFIVEDSGPGISPEMMDAIFDAFTQADYSNARAHGGVGLGLAISAKLAELMGGKLAGENLPVGMRFTLTLPLTVVGGEIVVRGGERIVSDLASQFHGKILIVEDDKVNQALLLRMLRGWGQETVTAKNGAEAIEAFLRESPTCILMDVQMPVMDGIEATRQIRAIERRDGLSPVHIIALTADIMPENRENCLKAGMDAYLNKPIKRSDLIVALGLAENPAQPPLQRSASE